MIGAEQWTAEERAVRATLFDELDRLAFALEMEGSEQLEAGREERAQTTQQIRLGVQLAQRLVSGVWSDEVHTRLHRWSQEYDARTEVGR